MIPSLSLSPSVSVSRSLIRRHFLVRQFSTSPFRVKVPAPVVTTNWVKQNLSSVKLVDSSWFMPAEKRNPQAEYEAAHLPGAVFFDLDQCADLSTTLPHMLPSQMQFASYVGSKGLNAHDPIVVYDSRGVFSSPRVWFTLKHFGASNVAILNGGLGAWKSLNLPLESGAEKSPKHAAVWEGIQKFPGITRYMHELREHAKTPKFTVLDARSASRFEGTVAEPRAGIASGHIPNTINLPFTELLTTNSAGFTELKSPKELLAVFTRLGISIDSREPIVTTCGTGVTASIIALALEVLGNKKWSVYDGSWTEWASHKDNPVATGPAAMRIKKNSLHQL